jgi:hypothetical protein
MSGRGIALADFDRRLSRGEFDSQATTPEPA